MIFKSNRLAFDRKHQALKDMMQGHMAMDIEVAIKTTAGTPVRTGNMKSQVRHFKTSDSRWRIEADANYSAVQEAGQRFSGKGAPTRKFSHYTTPGTSYGWFKRAADGVIKNKEMYVAEARRAVGL